MPVGVIPGFGGSPGTKTSTVSSGTLDLGKLIKTLSPELQSIFAAAAQHVQANPNATPAQDFLAGATSASDGTKGIGYGETPLDSRNLVASTNSILAAAGQHPHQKSPGLFSRVVDIISRPMYAMASGTQRAGEDLGTKGFGLHTLVAGAEGAASGIAGKNKEDFGKLLQEKIDIDKAKKDHPDWSNSQVLKEVQDKPGQAHNPWLTGLGGLALDITADPTSFLGAGKAVGLAGKGAGAAEHVNEARRLVDEGVKAGHIEDTTIGRATALRNLGVDPSTMTPVGAAGDLSKGKFTAVKNVLTAPQRTALEQSAMPFHEGWSAAMQKHLDEIFKVQGWDKLEPDLQPVAKKAIVDAITEHPSLIKSLKSVTFHADQASPGKTNKFSHEIHFGQSLSTRHGLQGLLDTLHQYKDATGLEFTSTKASTPEELLRHIITHEIGHHASNRIPGWVGSVGPKFEGKTQTTLVQGLLRKLGSPEAVGDMLRKNISGYAGKNIREAMAEAWAGHKIAPEASNHLIKNLHDMTHMHIASADSNLGFAPELIKAAQGDKVDFAGHLGSVLQHNLNPELTRALQIKFAGLPIAHIPVERLAKFVTDFTHGDNLLGRGTAKWEELFRSGKGVNPIMHSVKQAAFGNAELSHRAHMRDLRRVFDGVPYEQRKRVMDAYRHGMTSLPVVGKDGTNILSHLHETIQRIQSGVDNKQDLHAFNGFLPRDWKLDHKMTEGAKVPEDWLEKTVKEAYSVRHTTGGKPIKDMHDPGMVMFMLDHALTQMHARKTMWQTLAHTFGHQAEKAVAYKGKVLGSGPSQAARMRTADGKVFRRAMRADSRGKPVPLPYTKDHVFHPEIAKELEKFHTITSSPNNYDWRIMQMMKPATQAFKSLVTKWNPGFHERNLLGEVMASTMAGVHDPGVYKQAAQVLHQWGRHTAETHGVNVKDARAAEVLARGKGAPVNLQGKTIMLKKAYRLPNGTLTKQIPADLLMDLYHRNGLSTGWYSEFGNILSRRGGTAQKLGAMANSGVQHFTQTTEDFTRMAHFIDTLNKSHLNDLEKAAEEGSKTVRKYHFDYTDFTPFEKNVMSNIFPFYKWTRKNIPMQIEMLLTHPGRVSAIPKAESALSRLMGFTNSNNSDTYLPGADAILPDFLRTNGAFPVGTAPSGNTRYLDPALPTVQGFTAMQPGNLPVGGWLGKVPIPGLDTAQTMASPFLKMPWELATGRKAGGGLISDSNKYAASTTPYTNLLYSLMNKKAGDPGTSGSTFNNTKLIQFLAGIGLQENTPAYMQSQAKRDQQVASAIRKAYEKKHGTFHSTNHPGVK